MTAVSTAAGAFLREINVSRETISKFSEYQHLLKKWNGSINLVGKDTLQDFWDRHILDCAQIWPLRPTAVKTWVDIGSGGGFPGLVIALIAADLAADIEFTLIESDHRKASFLTLACQTLGISAAIRAERAESVPRQHADIISARALAPLSQLLSISERHLGENSTCLFLKGKKLDVELTEAQKYWKFRYQKTTSLTDSGGTVLRIEELERA